MIKQLLANKIKQLRQEKNITQKSLSDVLGCDQAFISKVERGVSSYNLEHIEKLCTALNHPVHLLFMGDDGTHTAEELMHLHKLRQLSPGQQRQVTGWVEFFEDEEKIEERRKRIRRWEDRQIFHLYQRWFIKGREA